MDARIDFYKFLVFFSYDPLKYSYLTYYFQLFLINNTNKKIISTKKEKKFGLFTSRDVCPSKHIDFKILYSFHI